MTFDLVVAGGEVVTPTSVDRLDVAVADGLIAEIGVPGSFEGRAKRTVDAAGCFVFAGGIDPHVHYNLGHNTSGAIRNEPQEYSYAAAFGGTTTIIDFAVQDPPLTLHEAVAAKQAEAQGRMAVDYGLHAIVTGDVSFETLEEIGDVVRGGVPTIKTFMTYGWMVDDGHRFGVMSAVAEAGGMSLVHAEDDSLAKWMRKKYLHEGKTRGAYVTEARGSLVEEAAVRRALLLAERAGSPLYVLHMAAARGVEALTEARSRGLPFYGETLAAYLSFTSDALWDDGVVEVGGKSYRDRGLLFASFPVVKGEEDRRTLWAAIADDRVQVVSSDHSAYRVATRFEEMGSTLESELMQGGQTAVELRVPVLYHLGVAEGRIDVRRFVELITANPAKLMGLYPRKGLLAPGSDADVTVFDPNRPWTVRWQDLHMSPEYSCWDGWELQGRVRSVVLRGNVLVENHTFVGSRTSGEYVPRTLDPRVVSHPRGEPLTVESQASLQEAVRP